MHGKNKKADEDERYSEWERYKMKRDAQRAGHPWKHAKGSTTEKEGKKSEKSKRVYDPEHNKEEKLWYEVAERLTELGEMRNVQYKVEGYQRNPEKGEEEERKAEKRRKESGRMPPRGDKRREDFERWYAANVR